MTTTRSRGPVGDGAGASVFTEPAPSLRRPRNLPGAVLGVLVVVVCSLVVASLASSGDHRSQVLVVLRPVAAGSTVGPADVGPAGVAADRRVSGIPADDSGQVIGRLAVHDLVPGTLVVRSEVATTDPLGADQAIVGLAVKDGDLPASLGSGDRVEAVGTPSGSDGGGSGGTVLVPEATVRAASPSTDGQSTLVSLQVPAAAATSLAAANATGSVSLVVLGR